MQRPDQNPAQNTKPERLGCNALVRGRLYRGYRLINHGYHPPDRCVWWQAENLKTGEADFHAHTRRDLKAQIDSANAADETREH